jgi:hypothetical protein
MTGTPWWVVCLDYTAGPFKDKATAERCKARHDGSVCDLAHTVVQATRKPEPPWQANEPDYDEETP